MEKPLTGAAGEYYIAFRLSALGYAIGLTPRGTRAADLLASNPETGKSIIIQTKTMMKASVKNRKRGPYWHWRLGSSRPKPQDTFYYTFVDLKGSPEEPPDVFIIPSKKITEALIADYSPNYIGLCIWEEDKRTVKAYLNRWGIIQEALGDIST